MSGIDEGREMAAVASKLRWSVVIDDTGGGLRTAVNIFFSVCFFRFFFSRWLF